MKWPALMMIATVLVCFGAAVGWWIWGGQTGTAVQSTPAPQVSGLSPVIVPTKQVKAMPPAAKRKLNLPDPVRANPAQHVVSASRVDPDIRPHTITTVLDVETGQTATYDTPEPMPWASITPRGEAGVAYGLRDGSPMGRLFLRQGLVNVKAARVGLEGQVDQDGRWFAGVTLSVHW